MALDLLARREHSTLELRHKLTRRGYTQEQIEPTLAQVAAKGWLSDARFAELYAANRVDKGYGPLRVRQALRERGVDETIINDVLAGLDGLWMERLTAVWRRRFGDRPADPAEQVRQTRFLRHRGFTLEQIGRLFRDRPDDD